MPKTPASASTNTGIAGLPPAFTSPTGGTKPSQSRTKATSALTAGSAAAKTARLRRIRGHGRASRLSRSDLLSVTSSPIHAEAMSGAIAQIWFWRTRTSARRTTPPKSQARRVGPRAMIRMPRTASQAASSGNSHAPDEKVYRETASGSASNTVSSQEQPLRRTYPAVRPTSATAKTAPSRRITVSLVPTT